MNSPPQLSEQQEAQHLLKIHGGAEQLPRCLDLLSQQLNVIQSRSQLLLTLSTLTLTITGFSGPQIAQSSSFARYSMSMGIIFVLFSMVLLLLSSLKIRWISQFSGDNTEEILIRALSYRNQKTKLYGIELFLLVIGLACYVSSLISYLLTISPN